MNWKFIKGPIRLVIFISICSGKNSFFVNTYLLFLKTEHNELKHGKNSICNSLEKFQKTLILVFNVIVQPPPEDTFQIRLFSEF